MTDLSVCKTQGLNQATCVRGKDANCCTNGADNQTYIKPICYGICTLFQLLTELVRLTDEAQMREQTDEEGDLFMWFKHQASNGVLSAQVSTA